MRTYIDPGHCGAPHDPGAVNGGRHEADDNLRLAKAVGALLEGRGLEIKFSRVANTNASLSQRINEANSWGADFFLSLHRNSHASAAHGIETFVYTNAGAKARAAAQAVHTRLVAVGAQSDRGVKTAGFAVLKNTIMPAILIELGFISNAKDNALFDEHFYAYAEAIAQGICEVFNISQPPAPPPAVHWAEEHYQYLTEVFGLTIHDRRFNDAVTRGEVFALLARAVGKIS
jgi:N-acetylmuramoyl-L-alanine amidase